MSEELTEEFMQELRNCSDSELRDRIRSHAIELRRLDADIAIVGAEIERRRARGRLTEISNDSSI